MQDNNRFRIIISAIFHNTLPILLPTIILSFLIWNGVGTGITEEIDSGNMSHLSQYASSVEAQFESLEHMEAILSSSPTIRYRLKSIFSDNGTISYDEYVAMDTASDFLRSTIQYSTITDSIYIYFPNREGWFFSSKGGLTMLSSDKDTLWFDILNDLNDNISSWSGYRLTSWANTETFFSIISPISASGGWNEGALILNANPEAITEMMKELINNEKGELLILDENNTPLFATVPAREATKLSAMLGSNEKTIRDGTVLYQMEMDRGWKSVLVIPYNIAYELNTATRILIAVFTVIIVLISFFISVRRAEEELENLDMLQRELNPEGKKQRSKHPKSLYPRLSQELFSSYLSARRLNDERTELELIALSLQLTPHFLYNTLQVIRWKTIALTGKENDASYMLDNLSALLGYVLGDRNLFSTLEDEINATKAYIAIQRRRFSDEFEAVWDISEEADGEIKIPKFILQPLIENAISHGIRGTGKKGLLKIRIFIDTGRYLKIRITDNGRGIDEDKLKRIRRALSKGARHGNQDISIGLGNVQTRLYLLFTPPRSLGICSREGKGTAVTFSIPLDSALFRKI